MFEATGFVGVDPEQLLCMAELDDQDLVELVESMPAGPEELRHNVEIDTLVAQLSTMVDELTKAQAELRADQQGARRRLALAERRLALADERLASANAEIVNSAEVKAGVQRFVDQEVDRAQRMVKDAHDQAAMILTEAQREARAVVERANQEHAATFERVIVPATVHEATENMTRARWIASLDLLRAVQQHFTVTEAVHAYRAALSNACFWSGPHHGWVEERAGASALGMHVIQDRAHVVVFSSPGAGKTAGFLAWQKHVIQERDGTLFISMRGRLDGWHDRHIATGSWMQREGRSPSKTAVTFPS